MTTAESTSRTGNIIAALATVGACDIAFGLTLQLIPLLMNERGWPAWAIGLNSAMGPIGILMAGPFLPRIIGRVGTQAHRADHHRRAGHQPRGHQPAAGVDVVSAALLLRPLDQRAVRGQRGLDPVRGEQRKPRPGDGRLHLAALRHLRHRAADPAVDGHRRLPALGHRHRLHPAERPAARLRQGDGRRVPDTRGRRRLLRLRAPRADAALRHRARPRCSTTC